MYAYYRRSAICYAYLVDIIESDIVDDEVEVTKLTRCKWFTRGWTLQELIAPTDVELYSRDWTEIGTRLSLAEQISSITGIDRKLLSGRGHPSSYTVAARLSWAANRHTTKIEDRAYCLMGLFDVNMPLIYGEGNRAFRRLQDEILKTTEDYSILTWGFHTMSPRQAGSPHDLSGRILDRQSPNFGGWDRYQPALARDVASFAYQTRYANLKRNLIASSLPSLNVSGATIDDSPPVLTSRGLRVHLSLRHIQGSIYLGYVNHLLDGDALCVLLMQKEPNVFSRVRETYSGLGTIAQNAAILPEFWCIPATVWTKSVPIDTTGLGIGWKVVIDPLIASRHSKSVLWCRFYDLNPSIVVVGDGFCKIIAVHGHDDAWGYLAGKLYSEELDSWDKAALAHFLHRLRASNEQNTDRAVKKCGPDQNLIVSVKRKAMEPYLVVILRSRP